MALGSTGPVETKVTAATIAAAASAFGAWVLRAYVFHGDLPPEVEVFADITIAGVVTFTAGWFARHTPRADPDADPDPGRHARRDG